MKVRSLDEKNETTDESTNYRYKDNEKTVETSKFGKGVSYVYVCNLDEYHGSVFRGTRQRTFLHTQDRVGFSLSTGFVSSRPALTETCSLKVSRSTVSTRSHNTNQGNW